MTKGERIRLRREQLGMTQTQLAEAIGSTKQNIYKYENNIISNVPSDKMEAIAAALHTDPAYLMGWGSPSGTEIPPGYLPSPKMQKVPLVGRIACGQPITAEENVEDYVDAPEDHRIDFALLCEGDSMIDAGIMDGDVVYIRKQPDVENGEIAAVRIDGEATLKRVYWDSIAQVLQLLPANAAYLPLVYSGSSLESVQIEGRAVGWTHWI